jgi:glycosyltransferase involved in cell wall biosynthesis
MLNRPYLSVVIPFYNERDNAKAVLEEVSAALGPGGVSYEIIAVDDGSRDGTGDVLRQCAGRDDRLVAIILRKNFGQTAALSAGIDHAVGSVIVTMDGDRQNDPADIPRLLKKLDEGYDIVSGWRVERKDPFLTRRLPSRIANSLISLITGVHLHDYGCSLKAFRGDVIRQTRLYGEMHRFIPAVASWVGVSVAELPVNHRPRTAGRSKYGLSRTVRVILDLLTVKFLLSYATRPIQIFGLIGLVFLGAGSATGLYLSFLRLFMDEPIGNRPLLLLAVLLVLVGIQLITMGLLAEMVSRTYHESQNKPIYVVKEILARRERSALPEEIPSGASGASGG